MLFAAKGTGIVACRLRIQRCVAGRIDDDAPVFNTAETRTLKNLVMIRAEKNEFHKPLQRIDSGAFKRVDTEKERERWPKDELRIKDWVRFWHTVSPNNPG